MSEFNTMEFLSDESLIADPYGYIAERRAQCPLNRDPDQHLLAITGYDAAMAVYQDSQRFSACNTVIGPFAPLPFEPDGDDISDQIAEHRKDMPFGDFMAVLDPPEHGRVRGLLSRLMTPRRLKENEAFMWTLADRQLDTFIGSGSCEFFTQYATPSWGSWPWATTAWPRTSPSTTTRWRSSKTGSPPTSKTAATLPALMC
jgi:cytochrome P450